jgi:DNA invertase Pin-like site-specific DNA recombinase
MAVARPLAGYIRVSHVGTRTGDRFHSPDEQAAEIRAWADRHRHQVALLEPELDAKGTDATRPILRQAVDGVRDGTYSGVVVAYLSRAGRDLRLMLDLWHEVEDAGGQVHFARESIDGSTANGRMQRNIMASVAQWELEERRDSFDRSRKSAVDRGIWKQRQTPRGYRRDPTTRRLVPDEQADEVRAAFAARAGGGEISPIARRLRMTTSGVRAMLKNRVYLGEIRQGEYVNAAAHEPLVPLELFEAAQRSISRPARGEQLGPALLAGLGRCASCGHLLTRSRSGAAVMYSCPVNHSGARCPAPAAVTTRLLDAHVAPIALAELARITIQEARGAGAEPARQALAAAEAELRAYLEAISPTEVGVDAFRGGARTRQAAIDAARDELQRHLARRSLVLPDATDAATLWETLDDQQRNTLLRSLLAAVVVAPAGRGSRTPLPERVRVVTYGTELGLPVKRGGAPMGIAPIPLSYIDDEHAAGVLRPEDRL